MSFANLTLNKYAEIPVLYLDIPVTGGELIHSIIAYHYKDFGIQWDPKFDDEMKKRISVIRGHFAFGLHNQLPQYDYKYITILRNPIERVIATYNFIRSNKDCAEHQDFKKLSFNEYVTNPNYDYLTSNVQTKYLSTNFDNNLDSAQCNLLNHFSLVGISERLDETLSILDKQFHWKLPMSRFSNNAAAARRENNVPKELLEILYEKNSNDLLLYRFSNDFLDQKLSQINLNKKIIINIPLNIYNLSDMNIPYHNYGITNKCFDKDWIKYRIHIFMNYTLKSLKAQTFKDYHAFIRYQPETSNIVENALKEYPTLAPNIKFIPSSEYTKHVSTLINQNDILYEVGLSSDDMYHKSFLSQLATYVPKNDTQVLICQNGYIYDSTQNRMAKYFNYSSTFNCLIYKACDYLNGFRYKLDGFESAIKLKHEILKRPNYINHSHENNTAFWFDEEITRWPKAKGDVWINNEGQLALFGEEILDKEEIKKILQGFI